MSHRRRRKKHHSNRGLIFLVVCTILAAAAVTGISLWRNAHDRPDASSYIEDTEGSESRTEETSEEPSREPEEPSSEASASEESSAEESASEEPASEESSEESSEEEVPPEASDDWKLILVNRWNPLPADYQIPELTELRNDNAIDSRAYPDLQEMFDTMRSEGLVPYITTSYRTHAEQEAMMDYYVNLYLSQEYSAEDATRMAEEIVAVPGTSEHELGLAVDISTEDHDVQEPALVWDWLEKHSYEYGFILRYPEDKIEITGISNEPWHFRYVGREAAKEIYEQGVCLEEYLERTDHE